MKLLILAVVLVVGFLVFRALSPKGVHPLENQVAPAFSLPDANNQMHQVSDYAGQWLVLYFYPKDDTPGCTKEACNFRDDLFKLEKLGAKVVGVSVDNSESHAEFTKKYHLPFPLLADKDGNVADSYGALTNLGVIKMAKRYTFLINPQGIIKKVYLNVEASKHSDEIIKDLEKLVTP